MTAHRQNAPVHHRISRRPTFSTLGAGLAVLFLLVLSTGATAQQTCESDSARRALDFWIGSWRIVNQEGQEIATSTVTKQQAGCLLQEDYSAGDVTGRGITFYDPSDHQWHQLWVDSRGRVVRYRGTVTSTPQGKRVSFEGEHISADGSVEEARMTLEPAADGRALFHVELSSDAGKSWRVVFDGSYEPEGISTDQRAVTEITAREPAARTKKPRRRERKAAPVPADPVPASPEAAVPKPVDQTATPSSPSAPASGGVQPLTPVADPSTVDPELTQVQMTSPMKLRLPLGPIESLPKGYSWSSRDTAPYICEGVSIPRVRVSSEARGKKVLLEIEVALFGRRFSQKVGLAAVLVDARGTRLADAGIKRVPIGRGSTAQATEGFVTRDLLLELDKSRFDELFTERSRPYLEIILTVP